MTTRRADHRRHGGVIRDSGVRQLLDRNVIRDGSYRRQPGDIMQTPAVLGGPYAYWRAVDYQGAQTGLVKDQSPSRRHHFQFGSTRVAEIVRAPGVANALRLPGQSGRYASSPDSAALSVAEFDIMIRVALDDWAVAAAVFVSKDGAGQRSFVIYVAGGVLFLEQSINGTAMRTIAAALAGTTNGEPMWLRATYIAATGDMALYRAADSITVPTVWTPVAVGTHPAGATFDTTAPLEVGTSIGGTNASAAGFFYRVIVKNGIAGATVFDADFNQAPATTSFLDATGKTVTINGSTGADSNDPKFLSFTTEKYVYLPGVVGNHLSTPDHNDFDILGDLDIACRVALDDWTPAATQALVNHHGANAGYGLEITTLGKPQLFWSDAAGVLKTATCTVATGVADGTAKYVRVTLDVDNGAAGYTVHFALSDDGVTYTTLGVDVVVAGVTSVKASTVALLAGTYDGSSNTMAGKFHKVQVRNGIDGAIVADFDAASCTQSSMVDSTGKTWTVNRSTAGRKSALVDRPLFLFGTDDYLEAPDHDDLDFDPSIHAMTILFVGRWHGVPPNQQEIFTKATGSGGLIGYNLYRGASAISVTQYIGNGPFFDYSGDTGPTTTVLNTIATRRPVGSNAQLFNNNVQKAPLGGGTGGVASSIATTNTLRVGRAGGVATGYADVEWIAAAIFRRSLTVAEIAEVGAFLNSGRPT